MRKRSNYRPKPVRNDAHAWVVAGMTPLPQMAAEDTDRRLRNRIALESIIKGTGTYHDADVLISALNVAEGLALVRSDLGADWMDEILQGQQAMRSMARRGYKTGRYVFTGPELVAVRKAFEVHDAQLDQTTIYDLEQAVALVTKSLNAGKADRTLEGLV